MLKTKHWRRLLVGCLALTCLTTPLAPLTISAQDSSSQPSPTLNLDETQRVGDATLGYISLPKDFSLTHDEATYKEWTNADDSLSVILRQFPKHKSTDQDAAISDVQQYLMDYSGYEIGKGNATFVYVQKVVTPTDKIEGLALYSYIRINKQDQQVPALINYNVLPAAGDQGGINLILIRVDHYDKESTKTIIQPLIDSWSRTE